ncbi:MAG: polysaccharide deacetylase family protein [Clostridia bacterium]|nr:polysaccharide deacetylase family protein [Clostridia bacterium]
MFIVFNKEKIYSYVIALSTIVILFIMASTIINRKDGIIATSASSRQLPVYSVDTKEKKIALTMNCAWNADDIDSILDTLSKNKIHITFFMVGDWVDKYPEYVKKIADNGHEIANHSNTHPHVNQLNIDKNMEEIKLCSEKIEKITGNKTTLYRGPYGEYNDTVINAAKAKEHITIQWNLDTLDYTGLTGEEMWKRLDSKLSNGSIILSHNGTKHTADSLELLLHNIKEKGYEVVTVSELIYKDNYTIDVNGMQKQIKNE